jgi:hypothetical protein
MNTKTEDKKSTTRKSTTKKSTFDQLNAINVNEKTEKKGNLTYLSWSFAWSEAKKLFPDMNRKVYEREDGRNYFDDGRTCWVKVGVEINGIELIDYLPIMDFRNQSITVDKVTSFDVNKTIQRSTTKALALHGLGLYIYAGEDLPEEDQKKTTQKKGSNKVGSGSTKKPLSSEAFSRGLKKIEDGGYTVDEMKENFNLTEDQIDQLESLNKK